MGNIKNIIPVQDKFLKLVRENQGLPVAFMVDGEVCCGDEYRYWLGEISHCDVQSYVEYKCKIFFDDDMDDLKETIADDYETDDEQEINIIINRMNWVQAIVVYIGTPDNLV